MIQYDDGKLYFIKDGERIVLNNAKEKGTFLASSTLKTRYSADFIRHDLGIIDYVPMSRKATALQAPARNLDEINVENIPMLNLPKAATDVERDVEEIIYIISLDEAMNVDGLPMR